MKKYMISYDLLKPGQNYEALWERLRELGARKILYSQWVLRTASMTALQIRDDLTRKRPAACYWADRRGGLDLAARK